MHFRDLRFSRLLAACAVLAAAVLILAPAPAGVDGQMMRAAGVVTLALGLWATAVLPEYLTSVIFLFLSVALAVAPPRVVMSGFSSGPVWLVFGGLIVGVAVQATGLGARIARSLTAWFRGSYFGVIAGIVVGMALFAFLVPSSVGRVMIMLPIILALAERMGFGPGTTGRTGMTLAVAAGTLLPSFGILTANVPNIAMAGAAESIYGVQITYGRYLLQHFPVSGLVSAAALPFLITRLFPATTLLRGDAEPPSGPLGASEKRLLAVLLAALALWLTDSVHGVAPAWVAMGAGILCLLPGVGIMPPSALVEKVNFGPWFFLAGMIGLGAVAAESGLGAVLGRLVLPVLDLAPGNDAYNFAAVILLGMGIGVVTTIPGQPAIMTAMAGDLAAATGWPLYTVLMAQVPSWSLLLFPYQVPPLFIAMQIGGVRTGDGIRILLAFTLFSWIVLVPLQYAWWRLLGYLG